MKLSVILIFVGFFCSCNSHKKAVEKSTKNVFQTIPRQIFDLELTACYGTCPVYKVVVFDNDSLTYEGLKFVNIKGKLAKKLPQGTVIQLAEKFRNSGFFKFENQYTSNMLDFPTIYISFTDNGITKKIMDYYNAPAQLKQLEILISDLVHNEVEMRN